MKFDSSFWWVIGAIAIITVFVVSVFLEVHFRQQRRLRKVALMDWQMYSRQFTSLIRETLQQEKIPADNSVFMKLADKLHQAAVIYIRNGGNEEEVNFFRKFPPPWKG